jgi:hypothetical protein
MPTSAARCVGARLLCFLCRVTHGIPRSEYRYV